MKDTLSNLVSKYKNDNVSKMRLALSAISVKTSTRTPVRTGSLRASWTANNGKPKANNVDINSSNPFADRNDLTGVINSIQPGDTYSFANGQPYVIPIEYEGHSAQAPTGMLGISVAEWQSIVNESFK